MRIACGTATIPDRVQVKAFEAINAILDEHAAGRIPQRLMPDVTAADALRLALQQLESQDRRAGRAAGHRAAGVAGIAVGRCAGAGGDHLQRRSRAILDQLGSVSTQRPAQPPGAAGQHPALRPRCLCLEPVAGHPPTRGFDRRPPQWGRGSAGPQPAVVRRRRRDDRPARAWPSSSRRGPSISCHR